MTTEVLRRIEQRCAQAHRDLAFWRTPSNFMLHVRKDNRDADYIVPQKVSHFGATFTRRRSPIISDGSFSYGG